MTLDCVLEPWTPGCEAYELPSANVTSSVTRLCQSMDWMPGCSVAKMCEATPNLPHCNPFSVLADICRYDMPGMKGCFEYKNMCNTQNSVVQQCKTYPPLPYLTTTKEAKQHVQSICHSMPMDGCELCPTATAVSTSSTTAKIAQCDWFGVYADLCIQMPEMPECIQFSAMCNATPKFPLCPNSGAPSDPRIPLPPPTMQMYFHFSLSEYILFKAWLPRSTLQFTLSCIALFSLAILYEWFLNFQKQWERKAVHEYQSLLLSLRANAAATVHETRPGRSSVTDTEEAQALLSPRRRRRLPNAEARMKLAQIRMIKGFLRVVSSTAGYMLMLVTMTYNVLLCLSVVVGFGVGSFLFHFEGLEMIRSDEGEDELLVGDGEGDHSCCG
ncbi:Ctr-domain-containing protein [Rhizoclosmatium globosum]|uniref:Copper transport protein n=1 Tax=Rhizoclosmatium globosum TaxID=329046 RepID=A0A1Y2CP53_9FUNG|nr:Ctr-domain-containing protein [Rhizoclosmatium globosum]|eukprot:ORY48624.1 Ctr-domain-containing protein [Rhizoclosmatium globosum]